MYNNGYIIVDCLGLYVDFEETPTQTISGLYEDFIKAIDTGKPIYVANLSLDEDAPVISPLNAKVSVDGTNVIVETHDISFVVSNADAVTPLEATPTYAGNQRLKLIDLGTEYTAELKADISSGKFEKALVGGYLTINEHKYYFAHADYWIDAGDTPCTTHHMVVVPDTALRTGSMNTTPSTANGYKNASVRSGTLQEILGIIETDFGEANILEHRMLLSSATDSEGFASAREWTSCKCELMSEVMVYGTVVCGRTNVAANFNVGESNTQLELYAKRPDLKIHSEQMWLQSIVDRRSYAVVQNFGNATFADAAAHRGIFPAFAIC